MIAHTGIIPFLLSCRCSHLLFVHIIIPPFHSSSVLESINTTSSSLRNEPNPSSVQVLQSPFCSHHHPLPIIPPFIRQKWKETLVIRQLQIPIHLQCTHTLLVTTIRTGITHQKFNHSMHHRV